MQVENQQLVDFQGDYESYLEANDVEREKMDDKAERAKEIAQDNIKAKSKVQTAL